MKGLLVWFVAEAVKNGFYLTGFEVETLVEAWGANGFLVAGLVGDSTCWFKLSFSSVVGAIGTA